MSAIILLIIGVILIFINIKVIKGDNKNSFEEKLNNISNDSEDFNFQIGKIRNEFGETIFELQKEIENLKEEIEEIKKIKMQTNEKSFSNDNINTKDLGVHKNIDVVVDNDITYEDNTKEDETENNLKVKEIKKLMREGLSTDEISQKLNIGKGEVLLIQKLYIK